MLPAPRRLAVRLGVLVALLAGLALAVSSMPGLDEVRRALADAAPAWLATALALEVASCLAFVAAFRGVFGRNLPWRFSYEVGMAAQDERAPPGGWSERARARRLGAAQGRDAHRAPGGRTVAFFLITSSVNFATASSPEPRSRWDSLPAASRRLSPPFRRHSPR